MPKQKSITECKHPNSRKTRSLIKQVKKASQRDKSKLASSIKLNLLGEKIAWLRDNLDDTSSPSPEGLMNLLEKYLHRFDDELEQIRIKHSIGNRKNRQHASREDIINMTIKQDKEEFHSCGIEIPDLLDAKYFEMTKNWSGELRFLQNFKLKRYSKKQLEELAQKQLIRTQAANVGGKPLMPEKTEIQKTSDSSAIDSSELAMIVDTD